MSGLEENLNESNDDLPLSQYKWEEREPIIEINSKEVELSTGTDKLNMGDDENEIDGIEIMSNGEDVANHMKSNGDLSEMSNVKSSVEVKSSGEEIKEGNSGNSEIMAMFGQLMQTMQNLKADMRTNNAEIRSDIQVMNAKLESNKAELKSDIQSIRADMQVNSAKLDEVRDEMNGLRREVNEFKAEIRTELNGTNNEIMILKVEVKAMNESIEGVENRAEQIAGKCNEEMQERREKCVRTAEAIENRVRVEQGQLSDRIEKIEGKMVERVATEVTNVVKDVKESINGQATELIAIENRVKALEGDCIRENRRGGLKRRVSDAVDNAEEYLVEYKGVNDKDIHPMYYLKFAKKFCEVSGNHWESDKLSLLKSLKGDANSWARENIMLIDSYEEFEEGFRRKFWSRPQQRHYENDLMGSGNFIPGRTDLVTYVLRFFQNNQYLDRPLEIKDFLKEIAKHLPKGMGVILATTKEISGKDSLEAFLRQLADVASVEKVEPIIQNSPRRFDPGNRYHRQYNNNRRFDDRGDHLEGTRHDGNNKHRGSSNL